MKQDPEPMTAVEKLIDSQKENEALREAIADAWQANSRSQAALDAANVHLSRALATASYWREAAARLEIK